VEKYCGTRQALDDNIIGRMPRACWIIEARNTHSEYVMLITFPQQQQSLRERASLIRCIYVVWLFLILPSFKSFVSVSPEGGPILG
jgi:hypothetical protein